MELRNQHVDNYSAFYVVEDDKVIVVRVLYSCTIVKEVDTNYKENVPSTAA